MMQHLSSVRFVRSKRLEPLCSRFTAGLRSHLLRAAVVVLLLAGMTAYAQEFRGTISGTVTDPSGAIVAGANITITETQTGTVNKSVSDGAGQYVVPFLPPGQYQVAIEKPGFRKLVRKSLTLQSSEHPIINAALQLGNAQETVSVSADAPLIDQSNASIAQVITTAQVADLPLNGRTPIVLTELAAGVIDTSDPSQVHPFDNNAGNAWSIGGTPSQTSEVLLDGAPDTTWSGALAYSPTQDSVQEVSVDVFDTDASFGHTIGGVLNQITKTGTNRLHGSLYEFSQISNLDANTYFNKHSSPITPISVTHYNQYGGTIGGPIFIPKVFNGKDKLFFFGAYEGLKDSQPATTYNTVPTAAERTGDFSALLPLGCPNGYANPADPSKCAGGSTNPYQLYNPFNARTVNGVVQRTPIQNNILTNAGPLDPVALKVLNLFPAANITARESDGAQNYVSNAPSKDDYNNEFARVDYNMSTRSHLFGDFRRNNRTQSKNNYFGNNATGVTLTRLNLGTTLDEVYTVNDTTVIDARGNWTYFGEAHGTPATQYSPSSIGLPASLDTAGGYTQLPFFNFSTGGSCGGFSSFQCLGDTGSGEDPSQSYQFLGDVNKVLGRQTFKVGVDARQYRLDVVNYGASSGSFTFGSGFVEANNSTASAQKFGGDLATFLFGLPSGGTYAQSARASYHTYYYGIFVQDDWRATDHLTLNLGVRFDRDTPYDEKLGRTVNGFDPTATNSVAAAAAANYAAHPVSQLPAGSFNALGGLTFPGGNNGAPYQTASHLFSPRIGFSYSPPMFHDKTVIRGGFGMFVQPADLANLAAGGSYSSNAITDQEGFSSATSYVSSNNNGQTSASTIDNPFPNGLIAASGSTLGASTFLGQNINLLAPVENDPYSLRWNLGVQQALNPNLLLEVDYVANHAVHLPVATTQLNVIPRQYLSTLPTRDNALIAALSASATNPFAGLLPGSSINGSKVNVAQLLAVHPQFPQGSGSTGSGIIEQNASVGSSNFESADVRIEQRLKHGISIIGNYGFSKLIETDTYLNDTDSALNRRISPFDHTHHFVVASTYELPVGRGKALNVDNRFLNAIVGDFTINGIYTFQTGSPIYFSSDLVTTGQPITVSNRMTTGSAINTAAFDTNSKNQFAYHIRTLPQTFSTVRQDGINNLDSSILKDIHFTQGTFFQLRFETFNTLNHAAFDTPNVSSASSSSFGTITKQANQSRQVQIGGRIVF